MGPNAAPGHAITDTTRTGWVEWNVEILDEGGRPIVSGGSARVIFPWRLVPLCKRDERLLFVDEPN